MLNADEKEAPLTTINIAAINGYSSCEVSFRMATKIDHHDILMVSKKSPFTKDFSNTVMFSSDAAYEKGWIRVAEIDDRIVGFTCVRHKTRWPETVLYFIGTTTDARSKGIGKALIYDLMQQSPNSLLRLNVMQSNERALKFYKEQGFEVVGHAIDGKAYSMTKDFSEDKYLKKLIEGEEKLTLTTPEIMIEENSEKE